MLFTLILEANKISLLFESKSYLLINIFLFIQRKKVDKLKTSKLKSKDIIDTFNFIDKSDNLLVKCGELYE